MHVGLADHLGPEAEIEPAAAGVLAFEDDLIAGVEDLAAQVEQDLVARHAGAAEPPGLTQHPAGERHGRHPAHLFPGADRHIVGALEVELLPRQRRALGQLHPGRLNGPRQPHRDNGEEQAPTKGSKCGVHGTCQCVLFSGVAGAPVSQAKIQCFRIVKKPVLTRLPGGAVQNDVRSHAASTGPRPESAPRRTRAPGRSGQPAASGWTR
ncbi:MAG: hypothetical protein R3D59_02440 [Paracoccaceae bacterium]